MIGSGGGPVAAECGPTAKGMAGQGRAGQGRAGQNDVAPLGTIFRGRAARAGQGRLGARQGIACLSHAPAPGPVLGLLRCDCRASSGASLDDASARSLLLFAAPAARFSLGFRVSGFRV